MSTAVHTSDALLDYLGLKPKGTIYHNLLAEELVEHAVAKQQGQLADSGALCVSTGEFTGRSPKDKFVVQDDQTKDTVWWGSVNQPFARDKFEALKARVLDYLATQDELYVRDCYAGADPRFRLNVRVINQFPWQNLFVHNLFLRPKAEELVGFSPNFTVIAAPGFMADPARDGTRQHNFTIMDMTNRLILIGGSAYTGEIKKGIFSALNYMLPLQGILSMHCSANRGPQDDVAIFFGLSGTGKTTLSADPNRALIGDDEHGWTDTGVFNFEGGSYAKCIDLTEEKEPQIWAAIKHQTLVENTNFIPGTRTVDYKDKSITENTRAAYPIHFIPNAAEPSVGGHPNNIFLLTADAFGVLPPVAKLTPGQAMYYFLCGYTSKLAGTEAGVKEPQATFSACFGQAFLPLHPTQYARLLGEKMKQHNVNVWLINTGWTGGPFGVGKRMNLPYTRAMITAALNGELENATYNTEPNFGLALPTAVPGVPTEVLNPRNTWANPVDYDAAAKKLAADFRANFEQYADFADDEVKAAAPKA